MLLLIKIRMRGLRRIAAPQLWTVYMPEDSMLTSNVLTLTSHVPTSYLFTNAVVTTPSSIVTLTK